MIDHKGKFIFIHVPRTGGTAILKALSGILYSEMDVGLGPKHISAGAAMELYAEHWGGYFKFGFVRNPFDWLVSMSALFFSNSNNINPLSREDVRWFIDYVVKCDDIGWVNRYDSLSLCHRHFHRNMDSVDFIGKFESIDEDFRRVCMRIGVDCPLVRIPNSLRKKPYSVYYDDEMRRTVEREWAEDLRIFGYTFSGETT